jgi:putative CocE/NonD family hydrolase
MTPDVDSLSEPTQPRQHATLSCLPASGLPAEDRHDHEARVICEFDVPGRMRDGVTLRANVYRPGGAGPWPTLLTRTPYDKNLPGDVLELGLDPVQAARRGFMVVIQDTRGRSASEGEWEPFRFERDDGYDTVEWAAKLPGSNGRVGMYGSSYCGITQWLAAIERPPSLAAISPVATPSEPMDGLLTRRGAVELGLAVPWTLVTGLDYLGRLGLGDSETQRRVNAVVDEWDRMGEDGYWDLPVHDMELLRRHGLSGVGLIHAGDDPERVASCRVAGSHEKVEVPSFHTAGWYDIFLQGTLDNYQAMSEQGHESRLIVGPWTHETFADPIGEQSFGMRAGRAGLPVHAHGDVNDLHLAWFGRHLLLDFNVALPEAPVRLFVMGRNEWRDEPAWPVQRAVHERRFLRSGGCLATTSPEAGETPSEFVYDPANPVLTVGGNTLEWAGYPAGPMDQAKVESRDDLLIFTSEPMEEDFEVTGRVRVILHAESSATSTDWVARLCDVHPDGRSLNLCDGILRVGSGAQTCARYEIDLWSTSNVFLRGHRLRVHVTSSSFPRWDRNLNTGNQRESRHDVARQRIYHDAARPSYIELPVIK